jgi:hypothetical protein
VASIQEAAAATRGVRLAGQPELRLRLSDLAVREAPIEGFAYTRPAPGLVAVDAVAAPSPLSPGRTLLRIAIQAGPATTDGRTAAHDLALRLVFPATAVESCRLLAPPVLTPAGAPYKPGELRPSQSLTFFCELQPKAATATPTASFSLEYRTPDGLPKQHRETRQVPNYATFREAPPAFRLAALEASRTGWKKGEAPTPAARAVLLTELRELAAHGHYTATVRRLLEQAAENR